MGMKVTVRVEVTTYWDETETFEIDHLERPYRELEPAKVGLSLAEAKDLLHELQRVVVAAQAEEVCMLRRFCTRCHRFLELKDRRIRKVDTVFGIVSFCSARIVCCPCQTPFQMEYPYSPMSEFVPERATAELLSLEARLSAQMPYRQVVTHPCESGIWNCGSSPMVPMVCSRSLVDCRFLLHLSWTGSIYRCA
jgi:hypothetical protein